MSATPVLSPVRGRAVRMEDVPDPVFAQLMVGPGAAVDPPREVVDAVAPVSGTVLKVLPHAFVILTADGLGVLVHLGIDTVTMRGDGFSLLATEDARVEAGQPVVGWDPAYVARSGRSPMCAVVVLDQPARADLAHPPGSPVTAGEPVFDIAR